MIVRFACPCCEVPSQVVVPKTRAWSCPHCEHKLSLPELALTSPTAPPPSCALCGNHELYKKKAFPHWLGLTILIVACLAFFWFHGQRQYLWAWSFLLGSALLDGMLFLLVGDAVVCYRCQAHHSCPSAGTLYEPYELLIAERYRQERLRREQLQTQKK